MDSSLLSAVYLSAGRQQRSMNSYLYSTRSALKKKNHIPYNPQFMLLLTAPTNMFKWLPCANNCNLKLVNDVSTLQGDGIYRHWFVEGSLSVFVIDTSGCCSLWLVQINPIDGAFKWRYCHLWQNTESIDQQGGKYWPWSIIIRKESSPRQWEMK